MAAAAYKRYAQDAKEVIEDQLERNLSPKKLRRYLELTGPCLLVITYVEDALRVVTRWSEQLAYLSGPMRWPWLVAVVILLASVCAQLVGAAGVVTRTHVKPASWLLLGFTGLQPFVYGQLFDPDFVFRTLTQLGGLLLLLRHEDVIARGARGRSTSDALGGLSAESMVGRGLGRLGGSAGAQLQLAGRSLLTSIFFGQALRQLRSEGASAAGLLGFAVLAALCVMVLVGFKARWSAVILAAALGLSNLWMFPYWTAPSRSRDFQKYYFYNTLSIMGGLLLLVAYGPGGLSMEGGKKGI